jgi:hypothetical protein
MIVGVIRQRQYRVKHAYGVELQLPVPVGAVVRYASSVKIVTVAVVSVGEERNRFLFILSK